MFLQWKSHEEEAAKMPGNSVSAVGALKGAVVILYLPLVSFGFYKFLRHNFMIYVFFQWID